MRRETPGHKYTLVKLNKSIHMVHNLNAITWHADKHIDIQTANELHVSCFSSNFSSMQICSPIGQLGASHIVKDYDRFNVLSIVLITI